MAFISIPSSLIQVGKAVKKSLFQLTKDNFDDLESRLSAVEVTGTFVEIADETVYSATTAATLTGVLFYKAKQNVRVTKVQIQIFEKGSISSGLLTVDLKKNSTLNPVGFASILTTQASINFASDPDFTADDAVINSVLNDLSVGDFLRVDVTALPATPLSKFRIIVSGELI
jgi:hypothetical protein